MHFEVHSMYTLLMSFMLSGFQRKTTSSPQPVTSTSSQADNLVLLCTRIRSASLSIVHSFIAPNPFRDFDTLIFRFVETSILRDFDTRRFRYLYFGTSSIRDSDISAPRYFDTSIFRYFDTSILRCFDTSLLQYFDTSIFRYFVTSKHLYFDTLRFR